MKISKKIIAVVLTALVLMSSLPVVAVSAEDMVTSDGIKYTVKDGKATVTGYTGTATDLVIPAELSGATVNTIGEEAFENNTELTSISLPETLTTVSENAFAGCTSITAVDVPDSVTSINKGAFSGCTSLKDVKLSKSLTYLGASAFASTAITEIEIPKSLDKAEHSFHSYSYDFNGESYSFYDGPFLFCESLKTVTFESGTTQVAENLFRGCTGLEKITIPDTVTAIEASAFENCLRLKGIDVPDGVTSIGEGAFNGCVSLKDVKLSKSLTTLGASAFAGTAIEEIEIPRSLDKADHSFHSYSYDFNGESYSFYDGPFLFCENLKTVTFEKGTKQIAENLFRGCTGLEKITIPDTVTAIEASAFENCLRLTGIVIPEFVTIIDDSAFNGCVSLKDVKLSDSLTTLGASAFASTAIEAIEIPASLAAAEHSFHTYSYAFNGTEYYFYDGPFLFCENLKTVTFEEGTSKIAANLFRGCTGIEEITIPEGVTVIEDSAFWGALRLSDLTIPASVTDIQESAFNSCASLEAIVLPESVAKVGENAFENCDSLKSFEAKNADMTIGQAALANSEALTDVKLPANLKVLSKGLFYQDIALESVEIPESVTEIGDQAFEGCTSLSEMTVPENVEGIGSAAFKNCTALKSINIPQSTKKLGDNAFAGCESLTTVDFADYSVTEISDSTFMDCFSLESVALPKGIISIGEEAFVNCTALFDVIIPESATEIADSAFSYPGKTTIYSQTGSYVEDFANAGGFTFVDNVVEAESIALKDNVNKIITEPGKKIRLEFVYTPEGANEVISLEAEDDWYIDIIGHDIYVKGLDSQVITAKTASGASYSFTLTSREIVCIYVDSELSKFEFAVGDELKAEDLRVYASYSDDTDVEVTDYTVEGFDTSKADVITVTVKWTDDDGEEFTTDYVMNVTGDAIEPSTGETEPSVNPELETGDVNKDGKLNIKDATNIQKYLAKMADFDEEAIALADFDGNGKLNIKDVTTIQKKLVGLI